MVYCRGAKLVWLGFSIAGFVLLLVMIPPAWINRFPGDLAITRAVQEIHQPGFHQLMRLVSLPGEGWTSWILTIAAGFALILAGRPAEGGILFAGVGSGALLTDFLKGWFGRPRPSGDLVTVWIAYPNQSFPSGHVTFYVELFGFLIYLLLVLREPGPVGLSRILGLAGLLLPILLVGISRIYLGAHWPSDVLGGYLVGGVWLTFMIIADKVSVNRCPRRLSDQP